MQTGVQIGVHTMHMRTNFNNKEKRFLPPANSSANRIGLSKNHLSIFSDRTIFRNSALTTIGSWSLRTEQRRLSFEEKLKLQI